MLCPSILMQIGCSGQQGRVQQRQLQLVVVQWWWTCTAAGTRPTLLQAACLRAHPTCRCGCEAAGSTQMPQHKTAVSSNRKRILVVLHTVYCKLNI